MFFALITTVCFSLSILCARRTSRVFGSLAANFWRLLIALVLLACYAHSFGVGLGGASRTMFLWSGCIGFGLGDIALFLAVSRIGSRLTVLLTQTLAAPFGALVEWLWIGTRLTPLQLFGGAIVLIGVALAVAPRDHVHVPPATFRWGLLFGLLSAMGQGGGAVISRRAYQIAEANNFTIDGISAAYQRIIGGVIIAGLFWWFVTLWRRRCTGRKPVENVLPTASPTWRDWRWVVGNALSGPVFGVSCFQWALKIAPTGVVLPIVATTPITVIPFAYWLEGDRPAPRALVGAVLAVGGVILLTLVSKH